MSWLAILLVMVASVVAGCTWVTWRQRRRSEFDRAYAELDAAINQMRAQIGQQLTPPLTKFADWINAVLLYVREGIRVEVNTYGEQAWTANLAILRCEERLALTVPRPSALLKLTGL